MKSAICFTIAAYAVLFPFRRSASAGEKTEMTVKIIDRQEHESHYTYSVPGHFSSTANTNVGCTDGQIAVNCSATTQTTGTSTAAYSGSFDVQGATFTLQLADGRVAVVNCDIKFAEHFAGRAGNHRNCRVPLIDEIQVEFSGDKAKLKWPVSIDGKKMQSETYKILAVRDKL